MTPLEDSSSNESRENDSFTTVSSNSSSQQHEASSQQQEAEASSSSSDEVDTTLVLDYSLLHLDATNNTLVVDCGPDEIQKTGLLFDNGNNKNNNDDPFVIECSPVKPGHHKATDKNQSSSEPSKGEEIEEENQNDNRRKDNSDDDETMTVDVEEVLSLSVAARLALLVNKKSPRHAIQYLSIFCDVGMSKEEAENLIKRKIQHREWEKAKKHALYPGAGEPAMNNFWRSYRKRISDDQLIEFMEWLSASDLIQNLAFGQKVVKYSNGLHIAIESVKHTDLVSNIVRRYYSNFVASRMNVCNTDDLQDLNEIGYDSDEDEDGFDDDSLDGTYLISFLMNSIKAYFQISLIFVF